MSNCNEKDFPLASMISKCIPAKYWDHTYIRSLVSNRMTLVDALSKRQDVGSDPIIVVKVRAQDIGREMFDAMLSQFIKISHTMIVPPTVEGPLPKSFNATLRTPTIIIDLVIYEEDGDVYKYTVMTITLKRLNSDVKVNV